MYAKKKSDKREVNADAEMHNRMELKEFELD